MLILSRYEDQRVIIDDGERRIEVLVVSVGGKRVRLGFVADKAVRIDRKEIHEDRKGAA